MRTSRWSPLVGLVALLAGLLFATSAATARGVDLRGGRRVRLAELIADERRRVQALERESGRLREQVDEATAAASRGDRRIGTLRSAADALTGPAGLTAAQGAGVEVVLRDAPRPRSGDRVPKGVSPDDLVVHEQDVLAVMNALWAGGAEAMAVMDERVISTSAVRCVGSVLLLHGGVFSPPYVIRAIGDPVRLQQGLGESPGVQRYRSYVDAYGVGYQVRRRSAITVPGYQGPVTLRYAR